MGALLLDRDLRTSGENSDVRRLARARTLVVLDALLDSDLQSRSIEVLGRNGIDTNQAAESAADHQPQVRQLA
jgi:hypothetical protein